MRSNPLHFLLTFLAALLLGACATTGPELSTSVATIRTGLAQTETETVAVFGEVNQTARRDAIERLVMGGQPPTPIAFAPVIREPLSRQWMAAYDGMDAYLAALQDLVLPGRSEATATSLAAVGEALQGPGISASLPAGTAQLFGDLAGALVQASSEKKAVDVMHRTDPAFRRLTAGLANLMGGDGDGTVRAIAEAQWDSHLEGLARSYRRVESGSSGERRSAISAYGEAVDSRDAQLLRLSTIRDSLLAIGEAHSSAAKGEPGAVLFWVGQINERLKAARDATEQAEE